MELGTWAMVLLYLASSSTTIISLLYLVRVEVTKTIFIYWVLLFVQAQFAQMRPVAMPPAPRVPMYPPGGPGIGQQIFYGQGPPAIIPSQVNPSLFLCSN